VLVRPTLQGEPLLTAQSIYYLDRMESVAHVRANNSHDSLPVSKLEYILDNYLFEFCKRHPESRMTFKVNKAAFWVDDPTSLYIQSDYGHTEALAIDQMNDPAVRSIDAIDPSDDIDLNDWDIGRNYGTSNLPAYIEDVRSILEKRVRVVILPTSERDGYIGKLRVVKPLSPYVDYFQARDLDSLQARDIALDATEVRLCSTVLSGAEQTLSVERVSVSREYNPILLSHFFSGVKELSPLKGYLSFYNVLEHYFDEAPRLLGRSARTELEQLKCIVELLVAESDVKNMLAGTPKSNALRVTSDLPTSSGISIKRLDAQATNLRDELCRWLYDIRCAVVHSKKTRKGIATASFEPYSDRSKNVELAIPFVRALAQLCIEWDCSPQQPESPP